LNITQITSILEHKYPMLLIDGVTHIKPKVTCKAYKNLTYNEWFFPAHFPRQAVMPGSLQIEAYTQAFALTLMAQENGENSKLMPILAGVDKVRFYKSIVPGDRLEIVVDISRIAMGMATASVIGRVNDEIVSECKLTYKIIE